MDFVTGLPISKGNTTFLTVVDRFSKMAHFIALPQFPSARVNGFPQDIVSDWGPQFVSWFWREFCRLIGATVSLVSGYHPKANGHRTPQPTAEDQPPVPGGTESGVMEPTADVGGVRPQFPAHFCHRYVPIQLCFWLSTPSFPQFRTRGVCALHPRPCLLLSHLGGCTPDPSLPGG